MFGVLPILLAGHGVDIARPLREGAIMLITALPLARIIPVRLSIFGAKGNIPNRRYRRLVPRRSDGISHSVFFLRTAANFDLAKLALPVGSRAGTGVLPWGATGQSPPSQER
jgi:hypothetical protein